MRTVPLPDVMSQATGAHSGWKPLCILVAMQRHQLPYLCHMGHTLDPTHNTLESMKVPLPVKTSWPERLQRAGSSGVLLGLPHM
jgi:hypothetical protein